jgi:hypothetical protein
MSITDKSHYFARNIKKGHRNMTYFFALLGPFFVLTKNLTEYK